MAKKAKTEDQSDERGLIPFQPEDRMREKAILSLAVLCPALAWNGWTAERGYLWIVPVRSSHIDTDFSWRSWTDYPFLSDRI